MGGGTDASVVDAIDGGSQRRSNVGDAIVRGQLDFLFRKLFCFVFERRRLASAAW